jgi:hypothetical protein
MLVAESMGAMRDDDERHHPGPRIRFKQSYKRHFPAPALSGVARARALSAVIFAPLAR